MNDVHVHILQLSVLRTKDGNDLHMYSTNTRKPFLLSSDVYSLSLISYRCGVIYIIIENNLGLYGDAFFGSNCIFQYFICDILACYKEKKNFFLKIKAISNIVGLTCDLSFI